MTESVNIKWLNCTQSLIEAERSTIMELHEQFSFQVQGYQFMPAYKAGRWDGWIRPVRLDGKFPVGLVPSVIDHLRSTERQVSMSKEFKEFATEYESAFDWLNLPYVPYDHQTEAVKIGLQKKRAVILSPTSSGKSLNVYALSRTFLKEGMRTLVVVNSIMLLNQLKSDFHEYAEIEAWDVDDNVHLLASGASKKEKKKIYIATWQTLQNIDPIWFSQWDAVIVDECHGAKAAVLGGIMESCVNAFFRIGLSGSLDGTTLMETSLVGHFGPIRKVITTKQLMDEGKVSKVMIKTVALKYGEKYRRFMTFTNAEGKKKKIVYADEVKLIISNPERNKFIRKLAASAVGNTLVLSNFVAEHIEPLYKTMKEEYPEREIFFISKEMSPEERERIRKLTETTEGVVIFASYAIFSTGISIKNLHNVILASPTKSVIRIVQTIGRVLRLHESKVVATVFDIADDMRCGRASPNFALSHFMERIKIYQKEQFQMKMMEMAI